MLDKRFATGNYKVGLDPALLLGNSQVIAISLLFIPLTIVIALLVPGNRVLPFGDLATIGFFIAMATGVHKGNLFRTLISGSVILYVTIWISNQVVELQTQLARDVNLLEGEKVASLDQGGSPITFLLAKGISLEFSVGFAVIFVLYAASLAYTFVKYKKRRMYVDSGKEKTREHESLSSHG